LMFCVHAFSFANICVLLYIVISDGQSGNRRRHIQCEGDRYAVPFYETISAGGR